jgi:glycosyltransferase involved in cell wall biosynthesis
MKILMVLDHEFPPDIRVENEIDTLISAGHLVHVACYTRIRHRASRDKYKEATIHRKYINKLLYKSSVGCLKFPFYFNFWRSFIHDLQQKHMYDAVHIHDLPLAVIGWEMKKAFGTAFVLDLHENWPAMLQMAEHTNTPLGRILSSNKQWLAYEKEMCRKADTVIVVVEEALKRLKGKDIAEHKITVVSNTLNPQRFHEPDCQPDPDYFTLFYAGGINKHRGLQYVVKALQAVRSSKPVRLWLAGAGSYLKTLKTLAIKEGVADKIVFFGWLPFSEMNQLMGKADVCLIPHSKSAHTDSTVPHKLFQYMFSRKAIVASDCLPIKRIVEESGCGLVYPFNDHKKMTEVITSLSVNPFSIKEMGDKGYQAVIKNYLWSFDAERLLSVYEN